MKGREEGGKEGKKEKERRTSSPSCFSAMQIGSVSLGESSLQQGHEHQQKFQHKNLKTALACLTVI